MLVYELMGRTSKSTVTLHFAPDVMEAINSFHETTMPDVPLQSVVQELVILGLSRNVEEGTVSATRRRTIREVKRWAFRQLGIALSEMREKVDTSAAELTNEEADETSRLR